MHVLAYVRFAGLEENELKVMTLLVAGADNIIAYLKRRGHNLDFKLAPEEMADVLAYSAMVKNELFTAMMHSWWNEEENYQVVKSLYASSLPFPLSWILPKQMQDAVQAGLGAIVHAEDLSTARLSEVPDVDADALYARANAIYIALAARLGDSEYFFGPTPCSLDTIIFSHLLLQYLAPLPNARLSSMIRTHPNLVSYLTRLASEYLGMDMMASPAFAMPSPVRFKRRSRLYIGLGLTAVVGYVTFYLGGGVLTSFRGPRQAQVALALFAAVTGMNLSAVDQSENISLAVTELDSYDDRNFKITITTKSETTSTTTATTTASESGSGSMLPGLGSLVSEGCYVLKVHNGVESSPKGLPLLHAQNAVLDHLASSGFAVPVPIRLAEVDTASRAGWPVGDADAAARRAAFDVGAARAAYDDGAEDGGKLRLVPLESKDGRVRLHAVRVLTWVDGVLLADKVDAGSPGFLALLNKVGATLGRMDVALASFSHSGAVRTHLWDLASLPQLEVFVDHISDADNAALARRVYADFAAQVLPVADSLSSLTLHNDANDQNVLVNTEGTEVVGVIDFGDMVYSKRVYELAILMAYTMLPSRALLDDASHTDEAESARLVAAAHAVYTGYADAVADSAPITDLERSLLFTLVRSRLAQSVTMSAYSFSKDPTNEYLLVTARPGWNTLRLLEALGAEPFTAALQ
ncbi:uncharacterized protein AMSG_11990 [Thecamonas trahens ATCC 50062]|uniref:Hydroxylysine kinase n=1 Tax=Thecamonas trahens ATCC 50062 TaxID=461836 RepID=A0A0L0DFU8_THETB|nr:hypothetical protein AMSG_11990 [Thecamonas trahens ATCC 50062]KNC51207.1 hypothetical protein AMSG_11990 [Thecamonas trahens ATCC 50062]|eukprot:XP_013756441.1 hypothetical protein AMSG_11990 [Thecamonas trahens ATCC 50062]